MKRHFIIIALILNSFAWIACSSSSETTSNKAANNKTDVAVVNSNVNIEVAENANTNLVPANNIVNGDANALRTQIQNTNINTKNVKPEINWRPAPDNSQVTSTMNKQNMFVEIRQFKNHPLLLKVERTPEDGKIKAFLKNGKVLNVPPDKIKNHLTDSAQDILAAVGIAPTPMPTPPPGAPDSKSKSVQIVPKLP